MINYSDNKNLIVNQRDNGYNLVKNSNFEKGSDIIDSDIYESNDDNTKNKGVWYNARTKCWLACIKGSGRHLRVFSVKKHGYKKAKMLALECKNAVFYNDNNEYINKKNINLDIKNESNNNNNDYINDIKYFNYKKNLKSNEGKVESEESVDSKNSIFTNCSNNQIILKNDKSNIKKNSEKSNKKRRYNTRRCNYNSSNELTKDNNNKNFHNDSNNIKNENEYISKSDNYSEENDKYQEKSNNNHIDNKKKKNKIADQFNYLMKNENNNNNSNCIITDKDFQIDSPEQINEENFLIKPFSYDYNDNIKAKNKCNENEYNVIFSNDYYSDYCYQNKAEYKSNFIDLTREALSLILQDLKKNVVPKVPVGMEKRERYTNSLRLCLRNAKFTKHFNELEPYLELFSDCIKNSKLPSHMDLKDQLFYLDKL